MNKIKKIVGMVVLLMAFTSTILYADTLLDKLEKEKEELAEQIEGGEERIKELEAEIAEIDNSLKKLDGQIEEKEELILEYNENRIKKEEEIKVTKEELIIAKANEEKYRQQVKERIRVMYEYGEAGYIEVLLEAKDLGDFFNRLEYLSKIFKYDEIMLEKLQGIGQEIATKEVQLEIEEATLEHLIAEESIMKRDLESLYTAKSIEMSRIEDSKELMAVQLIQDKERDIQLDKDIRIARLAGQFSFKDGDKFKWPTDASYRINSPFGYRTHPVTGQKLSFHSGIDIPAPRGSNVFAAASGQVVKVGDYGTYGNLVVINHGGGYYTYYAHNSKILVEKDDKVVAGDIIAKVGTTGRSTGPHIHFSVRKDGVWKNPEDYFVRR